MTNAEFWGLSKYIERDSLDGAEKKEWQEALGRAYEAFCNDGNRAHKSMLDFCEWFASSRKKASSRFKD